MFANLSNKVALVTGSTSGIGLACAKTLAKAGANIVLNGFGDAGEIEAIRKDLETTYKVKSIYANYNLMKSVEIKAMIDHVNGVFGGVDVLVNNAGMQHVTPIEDMPDDMYEKIIALNLSSNFYTTKYVLPYMKSRNWGRIINIASVHGLVGSVNKSPYVASKHGVIGMTKVVALENAQTGVTVNAICPGFVLTELIKKQIDAIAIKQNVSFEEASIKLLQDKQPSLKFVRPEQIGETALFLCSESASEIRGQAIAVDGGWTAQ